MRADRFELLAQLGGEGYHLQSEGYLGMLLRQSDAGGHRDVGNAVDSAQLGAIDIALITLSIRDAQLVGRECV